jgi:hypothetical protein
MGVGGTNVMLSLKISIDAARSRDVPLLLMARIVYVPVPAEIGVPVRYALDTPSNDSDKSDRKSGEKMFDMSTLLVKYVVA